ncbi:FtsQ-type POTRA domain-containing protein [Clostridium sp. MSJ-11]|uniref:FtsQ-type POTRA domain-containing protein n=1 Tax=Clostridium mobile TaxID=2841512 RepID=A0ABS6ED73_9CLOT|nr:FtsQ-type POTRA domain-containing protein [Clostridium mobile]MBU5482983.1 FtsQ-type POTRA domain-containing protein [Clostridium mobile]
MGEVIPFRRKEKNELIMKRRRKKFLKKSIIFFLFLISTLITLCLKHPFFNVKNIEIQGNKNISPEIIKELSNIQVGNNIFYLNMDKAKEDIKNNPYIMEVKIARKLPSTVVIQINEREAVFYGKTSDGYVIIDKYGVVLEKRKDIKGMNLVKLQGFEIEKSQIGEHIVVEDERKLKAATTISSLLGPRKDNYKIAQVDISDINNIQFLYKNIVIRAGNEENLEGKLNKAFNIISQKEELKNAKGYIDVSFKGNPVVYIEN